MSILRGAVISLFACAGAWAQPFNDFEYGTQPGHGAGNGQSAMLKKTCSPRMNLLRNGDFDSSELEIEWQLGPDWEEDMPTMEIVSVDDDENSGNYAAYAYVWSTSHEPYMSQYVPNRQPNKPHHIDFLWALRKGDPNEEYNEGCVITTTLGDEMNMQEYVLPSRRIGEWERHHVVLKSGEGERQKLRISVSCREGASGLGVLIDDVRVQEDEEGCREGGEL